MLAFGAFLPSRALGGGYGLVIGLGDNGRDDCPLPYTDADAKTIYGLLTHPLRGGMDANNVTLLLDEKASPSAIMKTLAKFKKTKKDDLVVIYFTGRYMHDGNDWAWMPYQPKGKELEFVVTHKRLKKALDEIPARKVVILDVLAGDWKRRYRENSAPAEWCFVVDLTGNDRVIMGGISKTRRQMFHPKRKGSHFTCLLADALDGAAEANSQDKTGLGGVLEYLGKRLNNKILASSVREGPGLLHSTALDEAPDWTLAARHSTGEQRVAGLITALEVALDIAIRECEDPDRKTLLASFKSLSNKLNDAQMRLYTTEQKLTHCRKRLAQSEAHIKLLKKQLRLLQEKLAERDAERGGGATTKPQKQPKAKKAAKANWTVTSVKGNLVAIGVGSDAEVKKGMRLVIYRDSQFVGFLKIQCVSDSSAVGVIEDAQRNVTVGDSVTTLPVGG